MPGRRVLGVPAMAALCLLTAAPAPCDELIQIPVADRSPTANLTYRHRISGEDEGYASGVFPIGSAYELYFRAQNRLDGESDLEGGGQFQVLPDGILTPGVAVGMWDITNSSPWGRRGFLALTKAIHTGQFGLPAPIRKVQLTAGTGTGRLSGVFGGIRLDLPYGFGLMAEYDTRRLNAGLSFSPTPALRLLAELQNGQPFLGGQLRIRY